MAVDARCSRRRPERRGFLPLFLIFSLCFQLFAPTPVYAEKDQSEKWKASRNLSFLLFNLEPSASFDIEKNGALLTTKNTSFQGVLPISDVGSSGDRYVFIMTGTVREPPSRPSGLTAQGSDTGCARLDWTGNPESNVVGYRLYYATTSVEQGNASAYDDSSDVGNGTSYFLCGLVDGGYFFALRAINVFGLLSPLSEEAFAYVSNGDTQSPMPPQGVSVAETSPGCASINWEANSEPDIDGYVVYYGPLSVARGETTSYADTLDVGNVSSSEICGFAAGDYYFSVRAYNTSAVFSPYSTEKSLQMVGRDTGPPIFSSPFPEEDATGVPLNTKVFFSVRDYKSGVDSSSVSVLVNGQAPALVVIRGDSSHYRVTCSLAQNLEPSSQVSVSLSARDLASPPNQADFSWTFETSSSPDVSGPVFYYFDPPNGAEDVFYDSEITIGIRDDGAGIDLDSIELSVNGALVDYSIQGDPRSALVRYENAEGFEPASFVSVTVNACDLAAPANCSSFEGYTFGVSAFSGTLLRAAIVPDGFWANDPARPLEVRDIPLGWTVRIFNTAGLQIKSFKNYLEDGYNWKWDFTNDSERKVARALYLIRVTDEKDRVKRTGRFVVQMSP